MTDALQLLRTDHNEVKELFKQFEQADDSKTKGEIAQKAIMELEVHAKVEEEIFYPALRKQDDAEKDMLDEADEEHHVAKLLMAELSSMRATSDRFNAKFTVLAELVKHHIDEEETELFPLAAEEGPERLERLGGLMERRKMELMRQMQNPRPRSTTTRRTTGAGKARTTTRTKTATSGARRKTTSTARNGASANGRTTVGGHTTTRRATTSRGTSTRATGTSRTGTARTGTRTTARATASRAAKTTTTRAKTAASTRRKPATATRSKSR